MKIYRVGGSVRDELLGLPVTDHDYVVVGESPESMIAAGYQPVGRDFPVFLHPETHDEYALARTERKHGRGHQGFVFHADSAVTLEADLERRDLTINAMARDERDGLVDPYGGRRDLAARTLRHVSPAFAEDPLRVLRVARFAARFGFAVADETEALMRAIVARGELADLSPERIWREFSLGLTGRTPSMMLSVLRRCGALHEVAPELDKLYAASAPGPQPDLGVVTALSLDRGAQSASRALAVQFGIAARHLSIAQAQSLSTRLRVGNDCRDAAIHAARLADMFERATTLNADEWLTLLSGVDATRRPERLMVLAAVIVACSPTQGGVGEQVAGLAREALLALSAVDYGAVKSVDASAVESGAVDAGPAGRVRALRLRALSGWLAYRHDPVAAGR